ncbi:hypothetical protein AAG570_002115 [Ranatra chinensis]|uniref:Reverse transcriptase RNase H-like domain-containing protein n=1 Tax=Ranatra chinensis TaxID=642074 RepID=A0ABD0YIX3_9HEMI
METQEDVVAAASSAAHTVATVDSIKTEITMIMEVIHRLAGVHVPVTGGSRATSSSEQCSGRGTCPEPIQHACEEGVIVSSSGCGNNLPNASTRCVDEIAGALRGGQEACGEDGPEVIKDAAWKWRDTATVRVQVGRGTQDPQGEEWGTTEAVPTVAYEEVAREILIAEIRDREGPLGAPNGGPPNYQVIVGADELRCLGARVTTGLLKKGMKFVATVDIVDEFNRMKEALVNAPGLRYPDFTWPFVQTTNASGVAVGAVLSQMDNKEDRPVTYASRKLTDSETRYATIERELLGVVWIVRQFRPYLWGSHFTVKTDHKPLVWANRLKKNSTRVTRWKETLAAYDFNIGHNRVDGYQETPEGPEPCALRHLREWAETVTAGRNATEDDILAKMATFMLDNTTYYVYAEWAPDRERLDKLYTAGRQGNTRALVVDKGREFNNAGHPRLHGAIERLHITMAEHLRPLKIYQTLVGSEAVAYNQSVQIATDAVPLEFMRSRQMPAN